jgi:hypothetical protein
MVYPMILLGVQPSQIGGLSDFAGPPQRIIIFIPSYGPEIPGPHHGFWGCFFLGSKIKIPFMVVANSG